MTLTIEIDHKDYTYRYEYEDSKSPVAINARDSVYRSMYEFEDVRALLIRHNNKTHYFGKDIIKNSVITITENEDRDN